MEIKTPDPIGKNPARNAAVYGLRKCKGVSYGKGKAETVYGHFHRWATEYEEFEVGIGDYTVALVEDDNGVIHQCPSNTVVFLDRVHPDSLGEWIVHTDNFAPYMRCSICGFEMPLISGGSRIEFNHCPECTVRMKKEYRHE